MPDDGQELVNNFSRSAAVLRRQYEALAAIPGDRDVLIVREWLAAQRRLVVAFDRARAVTAAALPRERHRASELARIDRMRYPEVRALGERFRPLQQLALAMRARHKTVVNQLPTTMRRLRERQAHFYMLNATDSPVAVGTRYVARHVFPLVRTIERLGESVGARRCEPSRT